MSVGEVRELVGVGSVRRITHTLGNGKSESEEKTMWLPSGDQSGAHACNAGSVRRFGSVPSLPITHTFET